MRICVIPQFSQHTSRYCATMAPAPARERAYFVVVTSEQTVASTPSTPLTPSRYSRSPAKENTPNKHTSPLLATTPTKQRRLSRSFLSPRRSPRSPHKPKRVYPRMMCMFCLEASKNNLLSEVKIIEGRASTLRTHLKMCPFAESYRKGDGVEAVWGVLLWEREHVKNLRRRSVELMADAKLPAALFARKSLKRFVEAMAPSAVKHLPSRKWLLGTGLDDASAESDELSLRQLDEKFAEFEVPASLLSDGWTNIAKTNVLGCQLVLNGCTHTMELLDPGTRHDGIAIGEQLEGVVKAVPKEYKKRSKQYTSESEGGDLDGAAVENPNVLTIGACVTDNAGQCGRARRILTLRHPKMIFLHCFAHDVNNLVKQVLRTEFAAVAREATAAVNYLNFATSTWLVHAKSLMGNLYNTTRGFDKLCVTRWNSIHDCFTSLLRVKSALVTLANQYQSTLPADLKPLARPSFWKDLSDAESVMAPLAEASYRLQQNENTVADVVRSFRDIYYAFAANTKYGSSLVTSVEGRWSKCEQPLFLVGFFLHPSFVDETRKLLREKPDLEMLISDSVVYYYRRFYGEDVAKIREELSVWLSLKNLGVRLSEYSFPGPSYWRLMRGRFPKLSQLCVRILSVPVHTANVERLFSELGATHTVLRNRLEAEKARKLHSVAKRVREEDGYASTRRGIHQ